jgi:MFS family permease
MSLTAFSAGHSSILGGRFITYVYQFLLFAYRDSTNMNSGMGVGSLSMIVPMYNAEVAPPEVRGSLIALQQLAICFGIMISFWIDYGTNYSTWALALCSLLLQYIYIHTDHTSLNSWRDRSLTARRSLAVAHLPPAGPSRRSLCRYSFHAVFATLARSP